MRAVLAGVIAAIEALAVALATLLVVTGFALLVWWLSFGLTAEPIDVVGVAGAVWLLAHFVPLAVELSPEAMQALGFAPEALGFTLSLAPLGISLATFAFAWRSGWRFGLRGGSGVAGVIGGMIGFGVAAAAVDTFVSVAALPLLATAAIPAALYAVSSTVAFVLRSVREQHPWWLRVVEAIEVGLGRAGLPQSRVVVARTGEALRLTAMLVLAYVGISGIATAVAFVVGFANVTAMSQALQLGVWGAVMMFVAQLAFLPNFVVWTGSWLTGAGFAIGSGTSASPFGALLGPLPGLPVLAAIPDGWGALAVVAPLVVALVAVAVGISLGNAARRHSVGSLLATVVSAAVGAGLVIVLLNWTAGGSAGPGRLSEVGPSPWVAGGIAAAELGIGAVLGALASRADLLGRAASVASVLPTRTTGDTGATGETETSEPTLGRSSGAGIAPAPGAVDPDDQVTVPIEFETPVAVDVPVIPRALDAEPEPDEWLTDVIDGIAVDAGEPATPPSREPELFDQQETVEVTPVDAEQGNARDKADPAVIDVDALVEAYSWDGASEPEPEEQPTGWRWPRKKG